jgi:8-oxo-dGTP pyrophosphatase MutT (NUDIX family)
VSDPNPQIPGLLEALEVRAFPPGSPEELARGRMLELARTGPGCLLHSHFNPGHFTASALVVSADGSRALLHQHRFLDRWLQFGGHCDGDADLLRVARREAEEESGIPGLIPTSHRPFDLDIHEIPANPARQEPAHLHFDVRFVLIAPADAAERCSPESRELRWFTPLAAREITREPSVERLIAKWEALLQRRAGR